MSDSDHTDQHLNEVAGLFKRHLGVSGSSLSEQITRGRKHLPAAAQDAAETIAEAERLTSHPRLRLLIDQQDLALATTALRGHVRNNTPASRRARAVQKVITSLVANILAVIVLVILVLMWRGFV